MVNSSLIIIEKLADCHLSDDLKKRKFVHQTNLDLTFFLFSFLYFVNVLVFVPCQNSGMRIGDKKNVRS